MRSRASLLVSVALVLCGVALGGAVLGGRPTLLPKPVAAAPQPVPQVKNSGSLPSAAGSSSATAREGTPMAAGHGPSDQPSQAPASPAAEQAPAVAGTTASAPAPQAPTSAAPAAPDPATAPAPAASQTPDAPAGPASARTGWASQGYNVYKGPNTSSRVMLTFDDCPNSLAEFKAVAVRAEQLGIALAFFPTGQCLRSGKFDPGFARGHGHYVFNHSNSHPEFWKLSAGQIQAQLGLPGVQTSWGRPPYGEVNATIKATYARAGMRIWLWTVDTRDWSGHPAQAEVVRRAVTESKAGGTVLMHMQEHGFSPDAVAAIQAGLGAKGLGVCRNSGPAPIAPLTITC